MKEVLDILSTDLFRSILNSKSQTITQLNAVLSLLIKHGIAFDLTFDPGNTRNAASASLAIFIRPDVTVNIEIAFGTGQLLFSNPATGQPF